MQIKMTQIQKNHENNMDQRLTYFIYKEFSKINNNIMKNPID